MFSDQTHGHVKLFYGGLIFMAFIRIFLLQKKSTGRKKAGRYLTSF
jgi:hypothetical protein